MATFTKRGRTWQVKVRVSGYPPQSATFDSKREAQRWALKTEAEMAQHVFVCRERAEKTTLAELLEQYRREVTPTKAGADIEKSRINVLLRDEISQYALANLGPKKVAAFRDRRLQKVSGSTVRRDLALLSAVINHAIREWEYPLAANPVSLIRRPKENPARERRLRPEEEAAILAELSSPDGDIRAANGRYTDEARNPWIKPFFLLALETAMRRSDLLRLRWADIDLDRRTAHVRKSKNNEGRTVPLSSKAVAILENLERTESGEVFPLTPNAVNKAWQRARRKANLDDLHFHDTRHEATSRLFEKSLNVMEVASITGHKDLTVLKKYTHLYAEDLAKKLG